MRTSQWAHLWRQNPDQILSSCLIDPTIIQTSTRRRLLQQPPPKKVKTFLYAKLYKWKMRNDEDRLIKMPSNYLQWDKGHWWGRCWTLLLISGGGKSCNPGWRCILPENIDSEFPCWWRRGSECGRRARKTHSKQHLLSPTLLEILESVSGRTLSC